MGHLLSVVLIALAGIGLALLTVQLLSLRGHLDARPPAPSEGNPPGISILKPLCGHDDGLAANLAAFATLDYPSFELLLGVERTSDAAYPIAALAARRWPDRVRVVVQRGAPGINPKVNQLLTLAAEARHEILVVSDSNVRPPADYLEEIAAHFADPTVGVVTHAIVGGGEERLGALFDGLHLSCSIGPGVIAAQRVGGQGVVVGKSMAMRRADLAAVGGFAAVKDVLAEDYVLGRLLPRQLGKRVVIARAPIVQHVAERTVGEFYRRYARWCVLHRRSVSLPVYLGEALLNPIFFAALGAAAAPGASTLACFVATCATKGTIDLASARRLRPIGLANRAFFAVPAKDLLVGLAWTRGLVNRSIEWRGKKMRVLAGTRVAAPAPLLALEEARS